MAVFRCKMCGGALDITDNSLIATCEYCGTKQTLPKLDTDEKANLYDRANHFRQNNEFDIAMSIYEQILSKDTEDAEASWSMPLCRYGIEYVEDPATKKRVPTVNRAQFVSIFDDEDYHSALQYADPIQREIYEQEATAIDTIQKGILAISQKEDPFDIFICYKESDTNGRRTLDSVLAYDIYQQLTQEGYKVFFSRITLEDKFGIAYEPYIFAALNSASVMIAVGTKPEYFNAVWVKNEWSRYLALIKKGAKKTLIPAYRDMDPYDLPKEFLHLQAQDISKLGFMQDLSRGIKKILGRDTVAKATPQTSLQDKNLAMVFVTNAFFSIESGDYQTANQHLQAAQALDANNADISIGYLLMDLKLKKRDELAKCKKPFDSSPHYQAVLKSGNTIAISQLNSYLDQINARIEEAKRIEREKKEEKIRRAKEQALRAKKYFKAAMITFISLAVCAAIIVPILLLVVPNFKISSAISEIENGNREIGLDSLFEIAHNYNYVESIREKALRATFQNCSVGDIVTFGVDTNNTYYINWKVLAKEDGKLLLVSEDVYSLKQKYDNSLSGNITWQSCSLRAWLNETFYSTAFNDSEQALIQTTLNNDTGMLPTEDKVFILSQSEIERYLPNTQDRIIYPKASWWYRNDNISADEVFNYVDASGDIDHQISKKATSGIYVRPAVWVSCE